MSNSVCEFTARYIVLTIVTLSYEKEVLFITVQTLQLIVNTQIELIVYQVLLTCIRINECQISGAVTA